MALAMCSKLVCEAAAEVVLASCRGSSAEMLSTIGISRAQKYVGDPMGVEGEGEQDLSWNWHRRICGEGGYDQARFRLDKQHVKQH